MNKNVLKESIKIDTQSLVLMGTLIAIEIVLSRFLSLSAWNMRIGFGFVPLAIAAMLLGPVKAGIVGAVADIIGAILFPTGAFFPGFTLTAFLKGVVYGLFLYKKQNNLRIFIAVGINQLLLSLSLNTLWISVLYGSPYLALFITRIMQCSILVPVEIVTISLIAKGVLGRIRSQRIAM
jgi:ECF transporter S component (folate family)